MERRENIDGGTEADASRVESVWDYPRPPRLESTGRHLRVVHAGVVVAETTRAMRILETSHPPVYYFPPGDVAMQLLRPSRTRGTFCEFKGIASYWDLRVKEGGSLVIGVAWSYANPSKSYLDLKDYLAFYANRVDECWVDGERVVPQPGDFYGGWISSQVKGPFKGAPGTLGWSELRRRFILILFEWIGWMGSYGRAGTASCVGAAGV